MKVKVGDKVNTEEGDAIIVFIGTYLVVYRDESGMEWTEESDCVTASLPCEIDFVKIEKGKK